MVSRLEPASHEPGARWSMKVVVANSRHAAIGSEVALYYAIYYGPSDWTDEEVAAHGQKLRSETGLKLAWEIPHLAEQWYNMTYRL